MIEIDEDVAATMREKAASAQEAIRAIHTLYESTNGVDNIDWTEHRLKLAGLHGNLMGQTQALIIYVEVYCK